MPGAGTSPSVLAHLAATWLVYRLALRITRDAWVAGAAALVFGLHPVHVEAVADITSIQEPLSTFFILAALLAFARSRKAAKWQWLAVSLAATIAALLAKESGMVAPVLIVAYAWIFGVDGREAAPAELGLCICAAAGASSCRFDSLLACRSGLCAGTRACAQRFCPRHYAPAAKD